MNVTLVPHPFCICTRTRIYVYRVFPVFPKVNSFRLILWKGKLPIRRLDFRFLFYGDTSKLSGFVGTVLDRIDRNLGSNFD